MDFRTAYCNAKPEPLQKNSGGIYRPRSAPDRTLANRAWRREQSAWQASAPFRRQQCINPENGNVPGPFVRIDGPAVLAFPFFRG